MFSKVRLALSLTALILFGRFPSVAQQTLAKDFRAATTAYDAGDFSRAASLLESLAVKAPQSFDVHALLGLTYAAQSKDAKAVDQMKIAAGIQSSSVPAHVNLATGLVHLGHIDQAKLEYQIAIRLDPQNYTANHNLAEIWLQQGHLTEALPLLETAERTRPDAYDNSYDLALTCLLTDNLKRAREVVATLVIQKDAGELHNLLGRIDEKEGAFIAAAQEFERAAKLDPTEDNLFVWASELLLHRSYLPAIDIFTEATKRYPNSPRLHIGLGMALYSRGEYEPSIKSLLSAADLNPSDARCYLFLSKAYLSSPQQAEDVIERFRRYANLEPNNAKAQFYYALSLWKGRRLESHEVEYKTVEALLQKSIALDAGVPDAHLQLGILYTDQHQFDKAFPEYERALALSPNLADAHFRLGRYYLHAGEKEKADAEFNTFKRLQTEHQAEEDKARAEVQQFIVLSNPNSNLSPNPTQQP